MKKSAKKVATADLGNGRTMDLEFIPVATIEADPIVAEFVPNAVDDTTEEIDEVIPAKTKKSPKAKKAKAVIVESDGVERRGRKVNPNSAHQMKLAAKAALIEAGEAPKRGRKSNPNSAHQMKLAERAKMIASGVVIKRGRKAGTTKAKISKAKAGVRVKLDKTNSLRVKGQTFITINKAEKLNAEAAMNVDFNTTLNHPRLGKMVQWNA
jgi:hypothetical protein